ncbi:MAG: hypothetical protein ACRDQ1_13470 [Sciscionella sp.]
MPRTQPRGRTLRWRRAQLVAAGYDELASHRLAADGTVDVHMLVLGKESSTAPDSRSSDHRSLRAGEEMVR